MRRPERSRRPTARAAHLIVAAWVLVLLALPAVLWLAGARQPLLESRAKEEFPTLNRSSVRDEATFRRLDTALLDRFPLREQALDLHGRIAIDLFRDSPNPEVAIGGSGYFYYVPELGPCQPGGGPTSDPSDAVDVLARTLVAAGRRTTVVMPRSKLFVHHADAPSIDDDRERCAAALEEQIDERLATTPGGISLDADLRALEDAGEPTFLRKDTHWNWRGREVFARRLLDRIRPGLAEETGLHAGRELRRGGDLLAMLARDDDETDRAVEVRRPPADPFPPGDVVLIGDSQLEAALISPLGGAPRPIADTALPGAVYCNWSLLMARGCDVALRRARVVVVEKVMREVQEMTKLCWIPIAVVGEELRGAPGMWERVGGARRRAGSSLTLPAGGEVSVRVRTSGPDVQSTPRLLRLPVERLPAGGDGRPVAVTMAQTPQAGPVAPCATPSQDTAGRSLFVPVPAGRRVSELVVRLEGAAGTRLGTPEEIALDGRRVRTTGEARADSER